MILLLVVFGTYELVIPLYGNGKGVTRGILREVQYPQEDPTFRDTEADPIF
jgi:hypothetical protein